MKVERSFFYAVCITASIFWTGVLFAETKHQEIIRQTDASRGNLGGVQWTVRIVSTEKNRIQERTLKVQSKNYDFLAIFIDPPRVKRQKVLMVDHNMWFMKPGLRKPVPISPRQRLLGAASYGDIAAANYSNDYEPEQISEESLNSEPCYVFDLKATHKKATYDRIRYWVSRQRTVGIRADFYTLSEKLFKSATYEYQNQIEIEGKTQPFISKILIKDALIKGNLTTMEFTDYKMVKLSPATFDLNLIMMR